MWHIRGGKNLVGKHVDTDKFEGIGIYIYEIIKIDRKDIVRVGVPRIDLA
jgi:hypothetical protein